VKLGKEFGVTDEYRAMMAETRNPRARAAGAHYPKGAAREVRELAMSDPLFAESRNQLIRRHMTDLVPPFF